jgi:tRNA (Thr-GGU) A37 N-methylase
LLEFRFCPRLRKKRVDPSAAVPIDYHQQVSFFSLLPAPVQLILHPSYSEQIVDGLMTYSHLWIIFLFHLNPRGKAKSHGSKSIFTGQKIKPPRAPTKLGVLATRAPHRPNPVGLSLCLLEDIVTMTVHGRKQVTSVSHFARFGRS